MIDKDLYRFNFGDLTVLYDVQSLDMCRAGDDLILSSDSRMIIELNDVKSNSLFPYDGKVMLELYSADCEKCLCMEEQDPYNGEVSMALDSSLLQKPGKYFLLIHNAAPQEKILHRFEEWKGAYRYTFFLLENGELLKHPTLKRVSLSPCLKLRVDWTNAQTELDRFDVIAYNEDWELMGKAERLCFRSSCFNFCLDSPLLWLDGSYFLVVTHNGEPFLRIDFCWKENCATSFAWEQLDALSPYYMLGKYLRKDSAWHYWQRVTGGATIRKQVAALFLRYAFDQKRMRLGLPECWKGGHHFALILEENSFDKEQLRQLAALMHPQLTYMEKDCNELLEQRTDSTPGSSIKGLMDDWSGSILCLHHLSAMMMLGGNVLLQALEEHLQGNDGCVLMLVGSKTEVDQVLEASSLIEKLMNKGTIFRMENPTLAEQLHRVQRSLMGKYISLSEEAGKKLYEGLVKLRSEGCIWKKQELQEWLTDVVLARFTRRLLLSPSVKKKQQAKELFSLLEADDIFFPEIERRADDFSDSMEKLHQMVGLKELKENLKALFSRSRMDEKRRMLGLPVDEKGGYHMVFTGNPGTGKTTIARMVGRVFHSLGILSKGGVIVTERSKLVGRFIGDTENNMQALLEQAKGNVLFIDEAYNLYDGGDNKKDYGNRVIDSLLTVLSQKNPDLIVILAGYEKEMKQMLESNPGMKGRFPYHFHFEDYTSGELLQIAHNLLNASEYLLTSQADARLAEIITEVVADKDLFFHNARWVEQFIQNGVLTAMAERLTAFPVSMENKTLFQMIELEDVEKAYLKLKSQTTIKKATYRRIGFVA